MNMAGVGLTNEKRVLEILSKLKIGAMGIEMVRSLDIPLGFARPEQGRVGTFVRLDMTGYESSKNKQPAAQPRPRRRSRPHGGLMTIVLRPIRITRCGPVFQEPTTWGRLPGYRTRHRTRRYSAKPRSRAICPTSADRSSSAGESPPDGYSAPIR